MDRASAAFAAALAAAPENDIIAGQALAHGVAAGDWPLALQAATLLEARGKLPPDARFLLLARDFGARDWKSAERQIETIEADRLFAFTVPVLRAWLAIGRKRNALKPLEAAAALDGAAKAYAAEHRPLILAALGRSDGLAAAVEVLGEGARATRLRLAAAGALASRRKKEAALALLTGESVPLKVAKATLQSGRPLPGAVELPADGLSELLVRIGLDMHGQGLGSTALAFTRLANFASPDNGAAWLLTAELLARQGRRDQAIRLLDRVPPADPYWPGSQDQKVRLLAESDRSRVAVDEARKAAQREGAGLADLVRLGEALMADERPAEAATAFAEALSLHRPNSEHPEWVLWLLRGGAHEEADQWPEARAALERAYSLAPDEPLVLNYLGYAQLERGENRREAERLIRQAHRLAPDNAAITDSLGWALFLKGDVAEAIPLLERAAAGEPADVEINEHLGDAYFTAGRRVDARFAWTAAAVYAEGKDAERLAAKIERGLSAAPARP